MLNPEADGDLIIFVSKYIPADMNILPILYIIWEKAPFSAGIYLETDKI